MTTRNKCGRTSDAGNTGVKYVSFRLCSILLCKSMGYIQLGQEGKETGLADVEDKTVLFSIWVL